MSIVGKQSAQLRQHSFFCLNFGTKVFHPRSQHAFLTPVAKGLRLKLPISLLFISIPVHQHIYNFSSFLFYLMYALLFTVLNLWLKWWYRRDSFFLEWKKKFNQERLESKNKLIIIFCVWTPDCGVLSYS